MPNFMHLKHVVLKKKISIFSSVFLGSNPGHPEKDPYWTLEPLFEQTMCRIKRQCYIPNVKQLSELNSSGDEEY